MNHPHPLRSLFKVLALALLFAMPTEVKATIALKIDLTVGNNLSTVDRTFTYNLGPTGMRGWIDNGWPETPAQDGYTAFAPYQILVTTVGAGTPAAGILAVDDVILGASTGAGAVPLFTSDARKSLGLAIGAAESGDGVLKFKRWRAGVTTDVSVTLPVMGAYSATAPYNCPKTTLIMNHAAARLAQRINTYGWGKDGPGSINALALLATGDPAYLPMLQTYARSIAPATLNLEGSGGIDAWSCYQSIFLAEYYMRTNDAQVFHGLSEYVIYAATHQSMYGTAGHGFSNVAPPGGWQAGGPHGSISWYGPVNSAGLIAQISVALGKKAGVVSAEIDPAIERAAKFFGYYVNRGSIPYGEHEPYCGDYQLSGRMYYDHRSNGKDGMAAVMFGCMDNKPAQLEYYSRMALAGHNGEAYGHTGQGFSYIWTMLGANMGGPLAVQEYHKKMRWDRDMKRRSDGSFVYEGGEQWAPGRASSYFEEADPHIYYDNPTAYYLLHAAIPLKTLYITGKGTLPANDLDAAKVSNALWAADFTAACGGYSKAQLFAALGEWDPIVRMNAATELATRSLTSTELNNLIVMAENPADANQREAACTALGCLQATSAIPALTRRLKDSNNWVRAKAAKALGKMGAAAATSVPDMLDAFVTNVTATYPFEAGFNWDDPLQVANGWLASSLFYSSDSVADYTINADKSLLYPAVRAGIKHPTGSWRGRLGDFVANRLTEEDVKALALDLFEEVKVEGPCDRMFTMAGPHMAMSALSKYHIAEGIDLCMGKTSFWGWDGAAAFDFLSTYDEAARRKLPDLKSQNLAWMSALDPPGGENATNLDNAIDRIDRASTTPVLIYGMPVASPQILITPANTAKTITLAGSSCRQATVTYQLATQPAHGTLTGTPPNLTYTPAAGYQGMDRFTFTVTDNLTSSTPGTVNLIVGTGGTGLTGAYYDNLDFTALKATRIDPSINFDWGSVPPNTLGSGTYSVRWTGQVLAPESGTYRFSTRTSDGVRLWINGVQVINDWNDQVTSLWNDSAAITLTAGQKYTLKMEYYDNANAATARLYWYMPSRPVQTIIPQELLYPASGVSLTSPASGASFGPAATITLTADSADVAGTVTNVSFYQGATLIGSDATAPYSVVWTNVAVGEYSLTAKATDSTGAVSTSAVAVITVDGNTAPVTSGLACWYDASFGTNTDVNQGVKFWRDRSGNGHDAVYTLWDPPVLRQNEIFTRPAIRFNCGSGASYLDVAGPMFVKEQYVVVRNPLSNSWGYGAFLGRTSGRASSYLTNGTGFLADQYPAAVSKNGVVLTSPFNLTTITNFMVLKITVNNGNTSAGAYQIGRGDGQSSKFDVAEILGYSRILTASEQAQVGGYLAAKYGIATSYLASGSLANQSATGITATSAALNATLMCNGGNYNVTAYWGTEDGGINPNNWANSASIGSWNNVASINLSHTVTNLAPGTPCYFTFRGTNGTTTIWATPARSFTTISTAKDILSFGTNVANSSATIDAGTGAVAWTLPHGTGLTNLAPDYTVSPNAAGSPVSGTSRNFATPQIYTITAQDGSTKDYTVTSIVAPPSTAKDLLTFGTNIAGSGAVITTTSSTTGTVAWSVPYGTTVSALAADYTVSPLASGNPVSGTIRNFATSKTYTITAQDGSTKVYTVTVTVLPNPAKDLLTFGANVAGSSAAITTTSSTTGTVVWKVPYGTAVTNLAPTYTVSPQASGSPASGTSRNFNTPQTYTITAQDGSTKVYSVTITWSINLAAATGVFLADTVTGGNATLAVAGNLLGSNQYSSTTGNPWHDITDGVTSTKWIQVSPGGWGGVYDGKGGFYFTLPAAAAIQGIQLFTEDSAPFRSPLTMTVEGSTATGTNLMSGASWTPLYSGSAGLDDTLSNSAGAKVNFTNNTAYTSYRVLFPTMVAANANCVQLADVVVLATVAGGSSPPDAPTGLTATPGASGTVTLTWIASAGATGYKVSIKNTATTVTQVVTTTASPYTATGLTNGTSYEFKVLGTNSAGDGAYSGVVSATPTAGNFTTTTTLAALTPSTYGDPVTFSATVAPAPTGGTVQFYDNNVALGSPVAVNTGTGVAQYTTSALTAGSHPITATFSGTTGISGSTASSKTQTVNPATPVVTVNVGSYTYNGSAQGPNTATTGGSTGAVTFSYVGVSGTTYPASGTPPTNAGSYTCTATVTADTNYTSASSSATPFTIAKATPVITWNNPSPIIVGTALGTTQLNATSGGVAGNFVYTPASGVVLAEGSHVLSVQFTPANTANYNFPSATTVTIQVNPLASLTITDVQWSGAGNHYGVSATDLINAGQATFSGITFSGTANWGSAVGKLNDGSEGGGGTNNGECLAPSDGGVVTVVLDTSVNSAGYDLSSIITLTGCADNESDRISQKYDVAYHVVGGAPGAWTTLPGDAGATVARSWTSTSGPGEIYGGEMKTTISGMTLTGVDQLRFTFYNAPPQNTISLYREIDVFGTATINSPSTFTSWAAAQVPPVTGGVDGDSNHDGVQNGIAYFMNDSGLITHPGLNAGNTVIWPNGGNIPKAAYGSQFVVQTSITLDHWDDVPAGDPKLRNLDGSVSYTLPEGAGKVFVRLSVTP